MSDSQEELVETIEFALKELNVNPFPTSPLPNVSLPERAEWVKINRPVGHHAQMYSDEYRPKYLDRAYFMEYAKLVEEQTPKDDPDSPFHLARLRLRTIGASDLTVAKSLRKEFETIFPSRWDDYPDSFSGGVIYDTYKLTKRVSQKITDQKIENKFKNKFVIGYSIGIIICAAFLLIIGESLFFIAQTIFLAGVSLAAFKTITKTQETVVETKLTYSEFNILEIKMLKTGQLLNELWDATSKARKRGADSTVNRFEEATARWNDVMYGVAILAQREEKDIELSELWLKADPNSKAIESIDRERDRRAKVFINVETRASEIIVKLGRLDAKFELLDAYTSKNSLTAFEDATIIEAVEELSLGILDSVNSLIAGISTIEGETND